VVSRPAQGTYPRAVFDRTKAVLGGAWDAAGLVANWWGRIKVLGAALLCLVSAVIIALVFLLGSVGLLAAILLVFAGICGLVGLGTLVAVLAARLRGPSADPEPQTQAPDRFLGLADDLEAYAEDLLRLKHESEGLYKDILHPGEEGWWEKSQELSLQRLSRARRLYEKRFRARGLRLIRRVEEAGFDVDPMLRNRIEDANASSSFWLERQHDDLIELADRVREESD
jgi:hypothetical protein